jgi:hypothetical protein
MEILGEYLREVSVLVLVFFPLELSKGGEFSKPLMWRVAEFSFATLAIGIFLSCWTSVADFSRRFVSAMKREFGRKEENP